MKRLSSVVLLLALLVSACGAEGGSRSSSLGSPLSAPATLTADELVKIDPELLAVIEWEEAHPGKGQEAAPDDLIFDSAGWIHCIVRLDRDKIVVTPTTSLDLPVGEQPAGRLFIRHGGRVLSELEWGNSVGGFIPLDRIKGLAQERAVIKIIPNRIMPAINE